MNDPVARCSWSAKIEHHGIVARGLRGLPNFLSSARAVHKPVRTLSRMRSHSSCAVDTIVKSPILRRSCPHTRVVVAGVHDVHCSTHPGADNDWAVVAGVPFLRGALLASQAIPWIATGSAFRRSKVDGSQTPWSGAESRSELSGAGRRADLYSSFGV